MSKFDLYTKEAIELTNILKYTKEAIELTNILKLNECFDPSLTNRQRKEIVLPVHPSSNIGRNDKCPCGSLRKYKKCCLNKE